MSVKVMGRVWDSDLPPNHRLVLLAYADAAEHDGTRSYPGEQRLIEMTGYSVSTVRRITAELLKLGMLVQVKAGHRGQRAEYWVALKASQSDTQSAESLSSEPTKPIADDTPPVLDPSVEILPSVVSHDRDEIWDTLVDLFGEPSNDGTRGKRNRVVKLLKQSSASPDDIRTRYAAWRHLFSDATITDTGLANQWDALGRARAFSRNGTTPRKLNPNTCGHRPVDDSGYCTACDTEVAHAS